MNLNPVRNVADLRYLPYGLVVDSKPLFIDTDRKRRATDPGKEVGELTTYEPGFFPRDAAIW
jgi:hypothetical protein